MREAIHTVPPILKVHSGKYREFILHLTYDNLNVNVAWEDVVRHYMEGLESVIRMVFYQLEVFNLHRLSHNKYIYFNILEDCYRILLSQNNEACSQATVLTVFKIL